MPYPTASITLSHPPSALETTIELPGSKSESNRALILQALSDGRIVIDNLSEADDTVTMQALLEQIRARGGQNSSSGPSPWKDSYPGAIVLNAGPAGTVMRFLTAFLCLQEGEFILTGSQRMLERPIGILVDALRSLGASITYLSKAGYPPLYIQGKTITGHTIKIPATVSSQYVSSLLLMAPSMPHGLAIELDGELTSGSYVEMTVSMMRKAGLQVDQTALGWNIPPQAIGHSRLSIEPDWSSASYWYALGCLAPSARIILPGLQEKSLQGDATIARLMAPLGVATEYRPEGIILTKKRLDALPPSMDFKNCPDIAQTVIVCITALGLMVHCTGLETLRIKETDRIEALQVELAKVEGRLVYKNHFLEVSGLGVQFPDKVAFSTYHDHRMALSLAPLVYRIGHTALENRAVVGKSYPNFWNDLQFAGIHIDI